MKLYPPLMVLFGIICQILIAIFLPAGPPIAPEWALLGAIFIVGGVYPAVSINRAFKQAKTSILPDAVPAAFIETGLFRYSRNPIYVGMSMVLAGSAIISGLVINLLAVPLFVLAVQQLWIVKEEANLTAQFGEQYAHYQSRVRRWV